MRCLRCALDFGPEVRYCDHCGRMLSRPPGQDLEDDTASGSAPDLSSLYSTFSPPAVDADTTTADIRSWGNLAATTEHAIATLADRWDEPGIEPASLHEARIALPTRALPDVGGAEYPYVASTTQTLPQQADAMDAPPPQQTQRTAQERAVSRQAAPPPPRNALPGTVRIDPPQLGAVPARSGSDLDDEFDVSLTGLSGKPLTIGADVPKTTFRLPAVFKFPRLRRTPRVTAPRLPRATSGRVRRVPRAALAAGPLVALAVVLGALAFERQATYTHDLQAARGLADRHYYSAAVARYQQAITDWPLNSAATQEQAQVAATATAVAAQTAASAQQQQALVTAAAARVSVYAAWQRMHRQNAQQAPAR